MNPDIIPRFTANNQLVISFENLNLEQYSWKVSKDDLNKTDKSAEYIDMKLPDNLGSGGEFRISCIERKDKKLKPIVLGKFI